jgi:hypothetical protein
LGFFYNQLGHTYTKAAGDSTETETKVSEEVLYLTAVVAPRLAFGYQVIPATLTLNGALVMNMLGPINSTGWQYYNTKTTNKTNDTVTTSVQNIFNPIKPFITLGAAWSISPYMTLESGFTINASDGAGKLLNEVSVGVVYKK